ncbi:serine/threonine-protein kinase Aurora-3-like [Hibiscus syriacus]|uniref:Serine/threonine-protein kinase Aurora-3-like n=1 Tax=Hibiscus syriacus TaxID=106335 RepID=A0A6A2ZXW6_HIBSY|nr:ankyrin repeat and zinc finger domain-containing protein 1-like [Hibiscus syriacus]KAE8696844.1 serine/threonine-protein kinase Aurora-3-like [Hibiscus syriacus]
MMIEPLPSAANATHPENRHRSVCDLPVNFFDSCRLLSPSLTSLFQPLSTSENSSLENPNITEDIEEKSTKTGFALPRWTCNTCKAEFDSLQDQRSHFKSDIHRLNIKLSIAGKDAVKEEDFDESMDCYKDFEVSSISGSEDEADKGAYPRNDAHKGLIENIRKKLFIVLQTGERVSIWKSLILNESESVLYENNKEAWNDNPGCLRENEVIERLRTLIQEPKDKASFKIVLLSSGGHFAGCVFHGNTVVAHKTFHRYVVRAKAGKKQSSKDATGKAAHSAGAALRRHNELALKKEIQELLASWKSYFEASSCVFIHAPSINRNVFFNGDKPCFSNQFCAVRNIPLTIHRPTLKEAKRIYSQLTQVSYEVEKEIPPGIKEDILSSSTNNNGNLDSCEEELEDNLSGNDASKIPSNNVKADTISSESDCEVICSSTPLHEAAQSGDAQKVMELLEQGLDPCIKDQRGRTPYMLASEKEVRNTFRRFMAAYLEKWDWSSAKVPSALTKEMEESQAAKQAEKDSKRKARAKELKKLRRAREKKAQAEAAQSQNTVAVSQNQAAVASASKGRQSQPVGAQRISEEELKRAQAIEREKRAAAAERRIAEAAAAATRAHDAQGSSSTVGSTTTIQPKSGVSGPGDIICSCCNTSLAGKVPFHRYNYKYCSASCMHVHREILEDT